jgi:hypothetical protein
MTSSRSVLERSAPRADLDLNDWSHPEVCDRQAVLELPLLDVSAKPAPGGEYPHLLHC